MPDSHCHLYHQTMSCDRRHHRSIHKLSPMTSASTWQPGTSSMSKPTPATTTHPYTSLSILSMHYNAAAVAVGRHGTTWHMKWSLSLN